MAEAAKPIGRLSRVILFVENVAECRAFYHEHLGLPVLDGSNDHWTQLDAGGCTIALHAAAPSGLTIHSPVKICLFVPDVPAARTMLEERGVPMGPIQSFEDLQFCDGIDPEGNPFQISNR